jgi:hypothetical protein
MTTFLITTVIVIIRSIQQIILRSPRSFVREPTAVELRRVLSTWDLDGSGRVSLEEHYFRVFADADGSGALTPAEYAASQYAPGGFAAHDLNADGAVSFFERTFIAAAALRPTAGLARRADVGVGNSVGTELSFDTWYQADLHPDYTTFVAHAAPPKGPAVALAPETVGPLGFSRYVLYYHCAALGLAPYAPLASQQPWLPGCSLATVAHGAPPWVKPAVAAAGGGGGNTTAVSAGGYMVEMWSLMVEGLRWNATPATTLPAGRGGLEGYLGPPSVGGPQFGRMGVGLLASWDRLNVTTHACTRSWGRPAYEFPSPSQPYPCAFQVSPSHCPFALFSRSNLLSLAVAIFAQFTQSFDFRVSINSNIRCRIRR